MTPLNLSDPIYHDEDAARKYLEGIRWPSGVVCPRCGLTGEEVRPLGGDSMGPGWYYCEACKDKFTVRTGAVYERSHIPLHKWALGFRLMASSKKGISAHQLHRTLGITYKSAWFMAHRIREAMTEGEPAKLGGEGKVVEADETFLGTPEATIVRGKVQRKRGVATKRKVVSLVERGGRARSIKVEELNAETIAQVLAENVARASALHTDEARHYRKPGQEFAAHETVNHKAGEYARDGVTTNTVEGFFGIFKRGMHGVYQHCGEQHLQRYLNEFDFRYSNRVALGIDDGARTTLAIKGAEGKRLTYRHINERPEA